ncbi:MAG: diacylglycerol kinase family protein [Cyclobacteriaceae bacterium]|nr:diacylglycerol kinase family protein [Cyclobacteriaceae bacterium]
MKKRAFSVAARIKSFKPAFRGLYVLISEEHNMRIHLLVATLTIVLGLFLKINSTEWMMVIICIALVLMAEAFNSAIEKMMDHLSPENHENVKTIKDISAAGVLLCAIAAALVGIIIFIPKIVSLIP